MTMYILDPDTLSLYQREHPRVVERVSACPFADRAITVIMVDEQLTGWYTLVRKANTPDKLLHAYDSLAKAVDALCKYRVLPLAPPSLDRYEHLRSLKLGVGKMDLRIAAIALEHGATVVTRNLRDFQRVPGLAVEDWSAE